jgi:Caspase domain
MVTDLFKKLHFNVKKHEDQNRTELENLLRDTSQNVDHENYDAFACVFMTHGSLGQLYTNDNESIAILEIVELFRGDICSRLRGKPKMFFIQACQPGLPQSVSANF